jgi:hypothetical protein
MKLRIPIVGNKDGQPVIDDFFENVCSVANINTGSIVGFASRKQEDNAKLFILIKDKVAIQKKYENVSQEILDIYPNRSDKTLVYFFEVDISEDKLDLLTEEELKLIGVQK